MSTDTSGTSTLLRWRPALIALTTVAAGLSIYYLHASEHDRTGGSERNAPGLHRSNATRRRSPRSRYARASIAGDRTTNAPETAATGSGNGEGGAGLARSSNIHAAVDDEDDDEFGPSTHVSPDSAEGGQSLLNLLYHIAEEQARMEGYVHRGVTCNSCNLMPIRGIRYRCANCPDYDLCEICEQSGVHDKTHLFYKIRIPAPFLGSNPRNQQPVWYPGKSFGLPRTVPKELKARLAESTGFERSRIDALWEQFKSLAAVDWPEDPDGLKVAIDRKIWAKYCMPTMLREHEAASALIFNQSFTFYDDNDDGLIGFVEFLEGLVVKQSKDQQEKLRRIFRAHDLDRDGYVGREDIMKLFTSNYSFMRELSRDLFQTMCEEVLDDRPLRDHLRSTQTVSSCFTGTIAGGDPPRTGEGKTMSSTGDWVVTDGGDFLGQTDDYLVHDDEHDENKEDEDQVGQSGDQGHRLISELFDDADEPPSEVWPPQFVTPDDVRAALNKDVPISSINDSKMRQQVLAAARIRMEQNDHEAQGFIASEQVPLDATKVGKLSISSGSLQSASEDTSNEQVHGLNTPRTDSDMGLGPSKHPSGPVPDSNVSREFLYRQVREGFEEVLDPMFKQLEDLHDFYVRSSKERQRLHKHILDFKKRDGNETLCEIWLARLLRQWRKGERRGSDLYEDRMLEELIRQLLKETELGSNEWAINLMDRIYLGFLPEEQLTQELDRLTSSSREGRKILCRKIRYAWILARREAPLHPDRLHDFLDSPDEQTQEEMNIEEPHGEAPPASDEIGEMDDCEENEWALSDFLAERDQNPFADLDNRIPSLPSTPEQIPATPLGHIVQTHERGDSVEAEGAESEGTFMQRREVVHQHAGIQTIHMPDGSDSMAVQLQQAADNLRRLQGDVSRFNRQNRALADENLQALIEMFHASFAEAGGDSIGDEMDYELTVDPTLPQNRPDTVDEPTASNFGMPFTHGRSLIWNTSRKRPRRSTRRSPAHQRGSVASIEEQNPFEDPGDCYFRVKIKLLAIVEVFNQQNLKRGGVALLNDREFEEIMLGSKGPRLETIGKWLDLAAF